MRLPIIGLVKREYSGFDPYITPGLAETREVLETGAEIVAFDATGRPRPDGSSIADAIELMAGQLSRLNDVEPPVGDRYADMAPINR